MARLARSCVRAQLPDWLHWKELLASSAGTHAVSVEEGGGALSKAVGCWVDDLQALDTVPLHTKAVSEHARLAGEGAGWRALDGGEH